MSDDLIKKYDDEISFVATEDELKIIQNSTQEAFLQKDESSIKHFQNTENTIVTNSIQEKSSDDLTTDYNYIRTNIYTITERSIEALNNLVEIADQSQHPRAYEVIALLVNTIAGAQKDLMTIHKDKNKIVGDSNKNSPDIVNNNLFVGNTAQLDEIISKMSQKKIEEND